MLGALIALGLARTQAPCNISWRSLECLPKELCILKPRFGGGWCKAAQAEASAGGFREQLLAIGVPMDDGSFAAAVTELSDANLAATNATLFVALKGIFDSLNSKKARDFFNRSNDEFREARIRLDQLVRYGRDQETEGLPATLNSFLSSPAGLPWAPGAEGEPYIFYRDDPSVAKKPRAFAERFQLAGGLCHQHAPAALSRAVQARSVEDGEARFVDMTSLWLARRSGEALRRRILYDVGGDSGGFLREITGEALVAINLRTPSAIRSALLKYGPLLLSSFEVSERFLREAEASTVFRLGEDEGSLKGLHAMMVVGIVGDTLLVQNWWRKAPFVQMSIDYLDAHRGFLSALPVGYREHKVLIGNSGRVMEAELNDVGERIMEGPVNMEEFVSSRLR